MAQQHLQHLHFLLPDTWSSASTDTFAQSSMSWRSSLQTVLNHVDKQFIQAGIQQLRCRHLMSLVRHGISETLVQICWIKLRSPCPEEQAATGSTRALRAYKMSFSPTSMHLHCSLIHLMGYYLGSAPVPKASVRDSYFRKKEVQIYFKGVYVDWDDTERFCR